MRCVDTGADTPTGGRLCTRARGLAAGPFMATYADGVADIDLAALRRRHAPPARSATVTVVRPELPFGVAAARTTTTAWRASTRSRAPSTGSTAASSRFEPGALTYLREDSVLEREPLERLAADGELAAYRHEGFWACMDTYKDAVALNDLWAAAARPGRRACAAVLDSPAMAGHSKWAGIKHKKAIVDSRRGKLFTKLARAITVAAKEGGGDVEGNPSLALAVQKAKDASMPKDNIERAIAKGTGEGADADALEAVMYEGYGPGGVALLVEALTDNRNRTGSEVRHAFGKHGGNLGEPGLGRLPVRQEGRGRRRRRALHRGRPDGRDRRRRRGHRDGRRRLRGPAPSRRDSTAVRARSTTPASRSRTPRSRSGPRRSSRSTRTARRSS